ncbi:hypothetical protein M3Y97_00648200 [Aphelenchoides bicaudatus]|nr:hypothetical protein M3Y97_00648200 [Aphelenchoides bicaudatus]
MLTTIVTILLLSQTIDAVCRGYVKINDGNQCGKEQTIFNEGECNCCYYDSLGIPTIGIGFNIKPDSTARTLAKYGLDRSKVLTDCVKSSSNHCLTDKAAREIFSATSYAEAETCVNSYAPNLTGSKRGAIVDMAFNLGCAKLKQFKKLQAALKSKDWKQASKEMHDSVWCQQVGRRCIRNQNCILT